MKTIFSECISSRLIILTTQTMLTTWIYLDHLDHLNHPDHPDHPNHSDHLDHMDHLDYLDHLDHLDHLSHLEHLDHLFSTFRSSFTTGVTSHLFSIIWWPPRTPGYPRPPRSHVPPKPKRTTFPNNLPKKVFVYFVYLLTIRCTTLDGSWVICLAQVRCLSDCWILVELNFAFVCESMFETWIHLNFAKSDFDSKGVFK